jgi:glycosyltransferase involved in cell wall biosynthesis
LTQLDEKYQNIKIETCMKVIKPELKLSVVIPITRMAGRLANLISTLEMCSKEEIEFILVHDEQDSLTQEELEKIKKRFTNLNVQLFRKTFNSPGLARNYGILKSTGDWFCFSDSDDLPQIYEIHAAAKMANEFGADVGIGKLLTIGVNEISLTKSPNSPMGNSLDILTLALNPGFTRFVFKSSVFKQVEFPEIMMGEDQVYLARSNFLNHKIYSIDSILYKYFTDIPSQSTRNRISLQDLPLTFELLCASKPGASKTMNQFINYQIMKIALTCLYHKIGRRTATKNLFSVLIKNPLDAVYFGRRVIQDKNVPAK